MPLRPGCSTAKRQTWTAAADATRNRTSEMSATGEKQRHRSRETHAFRYAAAAVLLAGVGVLLVLFDWNWFKGPVERRVSAATGREFRIEGDLDVRLGLTPTIVAEGLHLSNADWSRHEEMASIDRLEF